MYALHIHYENRTEHVPFDTLWAANLRADDWMRRDPNIQRIEITENGILWVTFIRR